jgi:hypothetical protein
MTTGERRIGVQFNPSANDTVYRIKADTAILIDLCEKMKVSNLTVDGEAARLCALAQTYYEIGAMFAVKAATAGMPDK